jgi:thioester reductase-like protein
MPATRVTLVTGFPNFRATHLVRHLLASCGDVVWAIVASHDTVIAESLRDQLPPGERARLNLLTGDTSAIDMGLSGAEYRALTLEVMCIQHLAQASGPAGARDQAESMNVGGMREALELARACPQLQALVVHSSLSVSGDRAGSVAESELVAGQRFPGARAETLARAELMARRRMHQLPIVVLRTGQILGPSDTGEIDVLDGLYLLILLILNSPQDVSALLGAWGDSPVNVIPVDYLALAAEALSRSPQAMGQTLHLTEPNPMNVRSAFDRCLQARARLCDAGTLMPLPGTVLRRDGPLRETFQSIARRPRPFIATNFPEVHYATEVAERLLGDVGLLCPRLDSYFDHLVQHVAEVAAQSLALPGAGAASRLEARP